jgi:hypothetical protein
MPWEWYPGLLSKQLMQHWMSLTSYEDAELHKHRMISIVEVQDVVMNGI